MEDDWNYDELSSQQQEALDEASIWLRELGDQLASDEKYLSGSRCHLLVDGLEEAFGFEVTKVGEDD